MILYIFKTDDDGLSASYGEEQAIMHYTQD